MTKSIWPQGPLPPAADRRLVSRTVHGVELRDEYAWLRADNWQEALRDPARLPPPIHAHLTAENAYADAMLAPQRPLEDRLFAEMKARMEEDDAGVPMPDGPFEYYDRFREGGEFPLICRRPRGGGAETILLDGDQLAKGHAYFDFGATVHSPDHRLMGWSVDDAGNEYYTIRVRDLDSGTELADCVTNTQGSIVWQADARAFYYVRIDDNHRPMQIWRHALGTPQSDDRLVYDEQDPTFFFGISATRTGDVAFISGMESDTSEIYALDLTRDDAVPQLIAPRTRDVKAWAEYHPAYHGEPTLFLRTNANGAEDYCVVTTPLNNPQPHNASILIPHRPGTLILSIHVFRDWLVRLERENALPRIVVHHLETGAEHTIAFDEPAYALFVEEGFEFATDELRFSYSSLTTPQETWDYDMRERRRALRKQQRVPSGHDPLDYRSLRLFAPAHDGEMIPISLIHHARTPLDGSAPLLLYGYGSYGAAMPARFGTARLSLVDRGFVYAIAHIRGGMDKGYRWYRNGKLEHKENTFRDFISCAEHLVETRVASPDRIVAHGGSAGGMLMGAVANMRPELFAGIIADVPFVDVINTMLDDTLPLTPPEWPEWGDPIRDPQAFHRMRGYCPYSNVAAKPYPPILAQAGVTDPRVTYWEPAKWVAKLRTHSTSHQPVILKTNMEAGHGGASGRFDRLKEVALAYAFALWCVGAGEA